jgi:cellobiose phosphorylase
MHKDWIVHDWKKVVLSNETRINHLCFNGINWCWIRDKRTFQLMPANRM